MPTFATLLVLAHQSDWLSLTLVLIPLGFFVWILAVARHRVERDGPVAVGDDAFDHDDLDHGHEWR